jgi:hypothetical protein
MARRITDKELAKWEAKGIAKARQLIDAGYTFEQVGYAMVNRGFNYQVKDNALELRVSDNFPRTRLIATFAA